MDIAWSQEEVVMEQFDMIKKNFGFGMMRLPMKDGEVDLEETNKMVDCFLDHGFNYFDTAHGYISGKSELAIRECLTKRYPRDRYILTDKLTGSYFNKEEDIRPLFASQLEACGVDYFDFYLVHNVCELTVDAYMNPEYGILDYLIRQKKNGKSSCGCGCEGCAHKGSCNH